MIAKPLLAAVSALALLTGGCAATTEAPATEAVRAETDWSRFIAGAIDGYFRHNPDFAVTQGRHEYDGQLPDWSGTGLANRASFARSTIAAAQAFDPAGLSARGAVRARLSDVGDARRPVLARRSPTSRTPTRLIMSASSIRRSTSPGPMRRPSSGSGLYRLSARGAARRRGRSAPICARRCR